MHRTRAPSRSHHGDVYVCGAVRWVGGGAQNLHLLEDSRLARLPGAEHKQLDDGVLLFLRTRTPQPLESPARNRGVSAGGSSRQDPGPRPTNFGSSPQGLAARGAGLPSLSPSAGLVKHSPGVQGVMPTPPTPPTHETAAFPGPAPSPFPSSPFGVWGRRLRHSQACLLLLEPLVHLARFGGFLNLESIIGLRAGATHADGQRRRRAPSSRPLCVAKVQRDRV